MKKKKKASPKDLKTQIWDQLDKLFKKNAKEGEDCLDDEKLLFFFFYYMYRNVRDLREVGNVGSRISQIHNHVRSEHGNALIEELFEWRCVGFLSPASVEGEVFLVKNNKDEIGRAEVELNRDCIIHQYTWKCLDKQLEEGDDEIKFWMPLPNHPPELF